MIRRDVDIFLHPHDTPLNERLVRNAWNMYRSPTLADFFFTEERLLETKATKAMKLIDI